MLRAGVISALVAGFSAAASAQPAVSGGFGWRWGTAGLDIPDADGVVDITGLPLGFHTLTLYIRTDDAEGLFAWTGSITATELLITDNTLRAPYTFSPTPGVISPDGTTITGIDAAHNPLPQVEWLFDQPMPTFTFPADGVYRSILRFRFTITDATTPRDIVISAMGVANVVTQVGVVSASPPESQEVPGSVTFAPQSTILLPANIALTLRIIPGPPGLAVLVSLGLAASRRRRLGGDQ